MMRKSPLLLLFAAILIPSLAKAQANVGVPVCGTAADGSSKYIPTDWATFTAPAKGSSYIDNSGGVPFGCRITRLTAASTDFGPSYGVSLYYDTIIPMSHDDKLIWSYTSNGSYYIVQNPYLTGYNGTAVPTGNMPSMNNQAPPMWDRTQPEMFYYTSGLQLRTGTITGTPACFATFNCTVTTALVHDFTGTYISLNMMDETSESVDGHHILLEGEGSNTTQYVFVWDTTAGTSSVPYASTCTGSVGSPNGCLHKMQISGDNNPIILYNSGAELLWNGTSSICLQGSCGGGAYTSHGATGQDLSGNPVWISLISTQSLGSQANACVAGGGTIWNGLSSINPNSPLGASTCLLGQMPNSSWHVGYDGGPNQPWVFTTYFAEGPSFYFGNSGSYAAPTSSNWPLYSGEIDLERIDANYTGGTNAKVIRLAQTRNRSQGGSFWNQTFGALSADGLYAVFSSDMAYGNVGCPSGANNGCGDLYLVSAPSVSSFRTSGAPLFGTVSGGTAPAPPTGLTAVVQ